MNFFKEKLKQLEEVIIPTKPLQWQTFLLVALLLWLGSILLNMGGENDRRISAIFGRLSWLFLTIGIGRLTWKHLFIGNFNPSSWITGALLTAFFYENVAEELKSFMILMWPLISFSIEELTIFFRNGATLDKSPSLIRKRFSFILLINLLLTSWLAFHFFVENWIREYPSLLEDNVGNSAFIAKIKPGSIDGSRGARILNLIEQKMIEEITDSQLEMSVEKMKMKLVTLKFKALEELRPAKENKYWLLETPIIATNSGYNIELQLIWEGPTAGTESYYLSKNCQIRREVSLPESGERPNGTETSQELPRIVNRVECGGVQRKALT
ncbi:MAG: DUF5357 family protein [Cyanobacteriota bacterium]|nr:DUF5357 family protein [Cyanobacteriota bacterium]